MDRLVYYEIHGSMGEAILCEKRLKRWHRPWKLELIEGGIPERMRRKEDVPRTGKACLTKPQLAA